MMNDGFSDPSTWNIMHLKEVKMALCEFLWIVLHLWTLKNDGSFLKNKFVMLGFY
jgi:hypothetical protein